MDINIKVIKGAIAFLLQANLGPKNGWHKDEVAALEKLRDTDFNVTFEETKQYTYEVKNCWYDKDDYVYGFTYVVSTKKYTYAEFESMCEKAREVLGKDTYDIGDYLIKNYGFKKMPIETSFEYEQFSENNE